MNIEAITEEILHHGNRKITIGFRAYAELKQKLNDEAVALGITQSEHCENLLLSIDGLKSDITKKEKEVADLTLQVKSLQEQINSLKGKTDLVVIEKKEAITRNDELNQKIQHLKHLLSIYNEPRLLNLFEHLKGREDSIITPEGDIYSFKYNELKDLIEAMIYSFKLKK